MPRSGWNERYVVVGWRVNYMSLGRLCLITTMPVTLRAFFIDQMQFLAENDFDITLICSEDGRIENELPDSIKYIPVRMTRGIDSVVSALHSIYSLYYIFRSNQYDIVQYTTPNAALYASIAARLARIPVRLYCQGGVRYVGFFGIRKSLFKLVEKITCYLSTHVEPVSKSSMEFSVKERLFSDRKGHVIWNGSVNGVNLDRFAIGQKAEWKLKLRKEYAIENDSIVIGYVGSVTRDKGINELLKAFHMLGEEFENIYLMLVGDIEQENGVDEALLKWARTSQNIFFAGFKDNIPEYMAAMDIFAFPSYREGFGIAIIEAEAMGLPVVVSDIPGPVDAMAHGRTGLLAAAGDVQALYDGLKKLIIDKELSFCMSVNGVVFVKERFEQKELWSKILERRKLLMKRCADR